MTDTLMHLETASFQLERVDGFGFNPAAVGIAQAYIQLAIGALKFERQEALREVNLLRREIERLCRDAGVNKAEDVRAGGDAA